MMQSCYDVTPIFHYVVREREGGLFLDQFKGGGTGPLTTFDKVHDGKHQTMVEKDTNLETSWSLLPLPTTLLPMHLCL